MTAKRRSRSGRGRRCGRVDAARTTGAWRSGRLVMFVAGGAALAAGLGLWMRPSGLVFTRTADQNVLLVTIDTLRADALSSYGGLAATPNLDRLARAGVRFEFAHAHAVVTLPSHASIMSGLYPFEHGIRDNTGYRLAAETPTIAPAMKATGAFIGAFPLDSRFGLDVGFDVYDDRLGISAESTDFRIAERPAEAVVASALGWLRARQGPWFAWVHVFDPHAVYAPPPPFDRQYPSSPYHGEVAYTDRVLGPLLDAARDASGRPTLVIATSDHGEGLGDYGELTHGVFAYESTLRVPLIVAQLLPAQAAPDTAVVSRVPARHIDIFPTLLDALDLPPRAALPGRSLLPVAVGSDASTSRASYFEAMSPSLNRGWAPLRGVIAGGDKYIDLPLPELFDLAADPGEQVNLADRDADRVLALAARLLAYGSGAPGDRMRKTGDVARRLRSLGYVVGDASRRDDHTEDDDPKRLVDVDRAIHEAIDLYQRGRPREALDIYPALIAAHPDLAIAYRHRAFLHWMLGDVDAAIDELRAGLARGIGGSALQTQLGIYLAETGEPEEAIALLGVLVDQHANALDAVNALGIAHARAEDYDQALATFERLIALDPEHGMAHENVGAVHLARGEFDEARSAFERARAVASQSARAHSGLGVVQLQSGDRDDAIASWTRAIELDPQDFDPLYNLAVELVNAGRLAAARPHLERFVTSAPPAFYADDIRRFAALLEQQ